MLRHVSLLLAQASRGQGNSIVRRQATRRELVSRIEAVNHLTDWRNAFIANSTKQSAVKNVNAGQSRDDKNRIRELERELRRKDAALAETAALLVLRKKLNAYWGSDDEDN